MPLPKNLLDRKVNTWRNSRKKLPNYEYSLYIYIHEKQSKHCFKYFHLSLCKYFQLLSQDNTSGYIYHINKSQLQYHKISFSLTNSLPPPHIFSGFLQLLFLLKYIVPHRICIKPLCSEGQFPQNVFICFNNYCKLDSLNLCSYVVYFALQLVSLWWIGHLKSNVCLSVATYSRIGP